MSTGSTTSPHAAERRRSGGVLGRLRQLYSKEPGGPRSKGSTTDKLLNECLHKLSAECPLDKRITFLHEFCDFVAHYRLDRMFLEHVWCRVRDLCDASAPPAAREAGMLFVRTLVEYHNERIGMVKADLWRIFQQETQLSHSSVETFRILIGNGRSVSPYEFEVSQVLVAWLNKLPQESTEMKESLLSVVINVVKFSFVVLPATAREEVIEGLCEVSNTTNSLSVMGLCLRCMDEIVRYSRLPSTCIAPFVSALCRTVNIERYSGFSWTIMKNVLQTYGYSCFLSLCHILDEPLNQGMTNLLRGAVFFLGMAVWGSQRISTLGVTPSQLLPSLTRVLDCDAPIVAHEVCLAIRRLIRKFGDSLHFEWEMILLIVQKFRPLMNQAHHKPVQILAEMLEAISELASQDTFQGEVDQVHSTLIVFTSILSEATCRRLQAHQKQFIHPVYLNWLYNLQQFVHYFYQSTTIPAVRLETLRILQEVFDHYQTLYSKAILSTLYHIFHDAMEKETDLAVYEAALQLLGHMLRRTPCKIADRIILLLQKHASFSPLPAGGRTAVHVLTDTFRVKWTLSGFEQTTKIYHALVELLNHPLAEVRGVVLRCLLQIRSDRHYRVLLNGVPSAFLHLTARPTNHTLSSALPIPALLKGLVDRLLRENSPDLFRVVLQGLHDMLVNQFLLTGCSLQLLADALLSELDNQRFATTVLRATPEQQSEFYQRGFQLVGLLLIGYRTRLPRRDSPFDLMELLFTHAIYNEQATLRSTCLIILAAVCVDFPAGISFKSSSLVHLLDAHALSSPALVRFLCCFLNSSKKLARSLTEPELTTLFSVVAGEAKVNGGQEAHANHAFRLLVLLFQSIEPAQRPAFYKNVTHSLVRENSTCLLTEANIDMLSRFVFSGTCLQPTPSEEAQHSLLFRPDDPLTHYLVGNALLSIQVGRLHWVRTTIRRASSRVVWISQVQNSLLDSHDLPLVPVDVWSSLAKRVKAVPPSPPRLPSHPDPPPSVTVSWAEEQAITDFRSPSTVNNPASASQDTVVPPSEDAFVSYAPHSLPRDLPLAPPTVYEGDRPPHADEPHMGSWSFEHTFEMSSTPSPPGSPKKTDYETGGASRDSTHSSSLHEEIFDPFESETADFPLGEAFSPEIALASEDLAGVRSGRPRADAVDVPSHSGEPGGIPLSNFYPPLPSYEDDCVSSPSFHDESELLHVHAPSDTPHLLTENKLSEDGQMLLHVSAHSVGSTSPRRSPLSLISSTLSSRAAKEEIPTTSPDSSPPSSMGSDAMLARTAPNPPAPVHMMSRKPVVQEELDLSLGEPHFGEGSSGAITIKKTRSVTAPLLRSNSMSPAHTPSLSPRRLSSDGAVEPLRPRPTDEPVHPSFIFLQMQQIPYVKEEAITLDENDGATERILHLLDLTHSLDAFKFGICYVREDQSTEEEILNNRSGSPRYERFLQSMGQQVRLKNCSVYSGGLDRNHDADGRWSIYFEDQVLQIMFHVATMMGAQHSEGMRSVDLKKRHIGNNLVNIIYTESSDAFDINTFTGQFNLVNMIVRPLEAGFYQLDVVCREIQKEDFAPLPFPLVVQESSVPVLLRETCLLAELACRALKRRTQTPCRQERLKLLLKLQHSASSDPAVSKPKPVVRSLSAFPPTSPLHSPR